MIHTRPLMREDPFMRDTNTYHLGAVFDEHLADEFVVCDVAATMTPDPIVIYVRLLDTAVNP
jgi:hypothetical protein